MRHYICWCTSATSVKYCETNLSNKTKRVTLLLYNSFSDHRKTQGAFNCLQKPGKYISKCQNGENSSVSRSNFAKAAQLFEVVKFNHTFYSIIHQISHRPSSIFSWDSSLESSRKALNSVMAKPHTTSYQKSNQSESDILVLSSNKKPSRSDGLDVFSFGWSSFYSCENKLRWQQQHPHWETELLNVKCDTLKEPTVMCVGVRLLARFIGCLDSRPACWLSTGLSDWLTGWLCINLCIGCSVGGESGGGGLNTQRAVLTEQISAQSSGQMLR